MRFLAVVFSLAVLTGCARARVTTEIRSGGAWTRTVALTGQEKKEGQMDMGGSIEDTFLVPSGDGWKSSTEKKDTNVTTTFVRTLTAGVPLKGDLSIKGEGGKPLLVNEVVVTSLGPRRFAYRETLRWTGPPQGITVKPEELAALKARLPKSLQTDENARALADKLTGLIVPSMFGPADPLLAMGLFHPDLAAKRMSQRIGSLLLKSLEEQFGDKMTAAERREFALKLIENSVAQAKPKQPDPSAGPPSADKGAGLTPLMFVLKTPGKIISSNGELDELAGEVFWALFPPAASLNPVVMTAVVELD